MNLKKVHIATLGVLVFLSACLKKEEPVELGPIQYLSTSSCSLNIDNFEYIFEKDIQKDIDCLEKNFNNYIKIVRRKDENYISYTELQKFVQHFYWETKAVSDDIFESGFDILAFLWGDAEKKFPIDRVGHIFNFSRFLNKNIVSIIQDFKNNSLQGNETYLAQRVELNDQLSSFGQGFEKFIDLGKEEKSEISLNIEHLLQRIGESNWDKDKVHFYTTFGGVFKRMLVGGSQQEITFLELFDLLKKLPSVALFLKDFMYLEGQKELVEPAHADSLFYKFFATFPLILHQQFEKDDVLLSHKQLSFFINYLYPNFEYSQIEQHVFLLKRNIFRSNGKNWNYGDIVKLLAWGKDIFGSISFNRLTYEYYDAHKGYDIVLGKKPPPVNAYNIFSDKDMMQYWKKFKLIMTRYRYFKKSYIGKDFQNAEDSESKVGVKAMNFIDVDNDDEAGELDIVDKLLISDDSNNDADVLSLQTTLFRYFNKGTAGVIKTLNEISAIRFFISRVVDVYKKDDSVKVEEIKKFLQEFAPLFEFLSIKIEQSDSFAEGVFDQIDFFQFQSNGNGIADVEEITEYTISLFFARKLAAKIYLDLRQNCPLNYSEEMTQYFFDTNCYRKRFFTIFFEEQRYRIYFNGLLNDPVLVESRKKYWNYFFNLEHLALGKGKKDGEIAMDKEGLVRLMLTFFNIEGIYERWDPDNNGIIGIEEIRKNYSVYRGFLYKKLAESGKTLSEKLVKTIYMYIIEKGKKPKTLDLSLYYVIKKEEEITSNREKFAETIHAIL